MNEEKLNIIQRLKEKRKKMRKKNKKISST